MQARGWTGLVVRRTLADGALTAAAFLVVLAAATALVAAGVYPASAARQGAIRALAAADPIQASITVTFDAAPADAAVTDGRVRGVLDGTLGSIRGTVVASGRSESWTLAGTGAADPPLVLFGFLDDLPAHATLASGTWPVDGGAELQAVVTRAAADRLGITVGTLLPVTSRLAPGRRIGVRIAGIIALDDPKDPAWAADPLVLDGITQTGPFVTLGPLFVTRDSLLARTIVTRATLAWTAIPAFDGLVPSELPGLAASTAGIRDRLAVALGPDRSFDVKTGLAPLLAGVSTRVEQAGSGTAVTAGQLLVLAVYALVLVAGLLVERRRAGSILLVARGAGGRHLLGLVALEAVILAVPATALGVPLGLGVVAAMGGGAPGGPGLPGGVATGSIATVAAGTALIAIAGFVAPTLAGVGPVARLRRTMSRRRAGAAVTRGGLDIALVAVAGLGLWQLRAGSPAAGGATRALGPLDVAAPAVALVAGAVLSLRVTPALARAVELILARGAGAAGALGGRSIARRSAAAARPVLLLVAAAGLALFCVEFGRTWEGSQRDQVAHAVAGDVAGTVPPTDTTSRWAARGTYLAIPGVSAASPVLATTFDAGPSLRRGALLAVPADPALTDAALRPDLAAQPVDLLLRGLASARPALPLLAIPAGTARVRVSVATSLLAVLNGKPDPAGRPGLAATLVVQERDGTLLRPDDTAEVPGTGTFVIALAPAVTDAVAIVAIEVDVRPRDGRPVAGGLAVTGIETTAAASGDAGWTPLDLAPARAAWGFTRLAFGTGPDPAAADPSDPTAARIPVDAPLTGPGSATLAYRPAALAGLAPAPIAALVDQAALDAGLAGAGATMTLRTGLNETRRIVTSGPLASFPGIAAPGFAVVDLGTWQLVGYGSTGVIPSPTGWWLRTGGGDAGETGDAAVAAAIAAGPYALDGVRARATETRARLDDPVATSILGTLDLVAAAALVFAALGGLAASWTAGRSRRAEIAVLLALGLSRRQLVGLVVAGEAFPAVTGLAGGMALGLALGALVLPAMTRAIDGAAPVPSSLLVVPWDLAAGLVLAGGAFVALATLAQLRSIDRVPPAEALRRDAAGAEA